LAVNPTISSKGYGTSILQHLIHEAKTIAKQTDDIHDALFLDVYITSQRAIALYERCGFVSVVPHRTLIDSENNLEYLVMMNRVSDS
jgi:ribosomal protein S18 acetylase RimI-like enzyme